MVSGRQQLRSLLWRVRVSRIPDILLYAVTIKIHSFDSYLS